MFIALQGNCNVLNNKRVINIVSEILLETSLSFVFVNADGRWSVYFSLDDD